jgi:hypothetical protein
VSKTLAPPLITGLNLRADSMTANIEMVALVVDGSGEPADNIVFLEDDGSHSRL